MPLQKGSAEVNQLTSKSLKMYGLTCNKVSVRLVKTEIAADQHERRPANEKVYQRGLLTWENTLIRRMRSGTSRP